MGEIELIGPQKLQLAHYGETSNAFPVKFYEFGRTELEMRGLCGEPLAQEAWLGQGRF